MSRIYHVLSLGAGVQSSTMALMAAHELIKPMPDFAVFADTQTEPQAVYDWLTWLREQLPFPVLTASHGHLGNDSLVVKTSKSGKRRLDLGVPLYSTYQGRKIMLARECTKHYKINVVARAIKQELGWKASPRTCRVQQWIGISTDEAHRMKPSPRAWMENRWPLIELLMNRQDCIAWLQSQGYSTPPKSACYFCPYKSNRQWHEMKQHDPASFAAAVEWEQRINAAREGTAFLDAPVRIHASLQPLDQIDFIDERQITLFDKDGFGNECEGMCGV